jgi:hypothetical protein
MNCNVYHLSLGRLAGYQTMAPLFIAVFGTIYSTLFTSILATAASMVDCTGTEEDGKEVRRHEFIRAHPRGTWARVTIDQFIHLTLQTLGAWGIY